jgi:type II secretory pathway pseudopilin PulG
MSSQFSRTKKTQHGRSLAGFGIIELLVSISIMAVVSAVILVKQNAFNSAVLLRSQAYSVALTAREVQQNAVSASGITGDFRSLHGLYFDTANPNIYGIFIDADNDGFFDSDEAFGKQGILDERFSITGLRTVRNGIETSVPTIAVVFERPNFDARFFTGPNTEQTNVTSVEIDITRRTQSGNTSTETRTIEITSTGQIAVQ